jgi:hypothetical protein
MCGAAFISACRDQPHSAASRIATFSSVLHARRRRTVLITSGNLVITVLKCSRKDSCDHVFAARRQALTWPQPAKDA